MRGKNNEDWVQKHKEHIQASDRKMQSKLARKPFFLANTATAKNYLTWFRFFSKPHLLPPEARSRQIWPKM
ncbi:hypothetical protein PVK06_030620 [Gossypium arboreum]|uniref:Uncharacterized protein n=1 Tax=Gossypium arboreum TaxID=29729 RepID=A0ABR0NNR7_GOSAR|nr:hypothetical protein PVK06_030620 [Gossypium arboreum]